MSRRSRLLMEYGFVPINPAGDLLEGLMDVTALDLALYQGRSMALLKLLRGRRRAALFAIRTEHADGRPSTGVRNEIVQSVAWGIPVVTSVDDLHRLRAEAE
jgi:hypothetical protein